MVLRVLAIFSISMLLGAQAYNLMRGAGDSAFSFFIALGVVLGLFVGEALLTAVMTQRSNPGKEMVMICLLLGGCMYGEYLVFKAGHVSMAIGGYRQIDAELENTYEMRLLREQKNNALWNSHNCGKSGTCEDHAALDARSDALTEKMTSLRDERTETPTQAAMKATGHDVSSVAQNFAALIQLVSIILAGAIGVVWGADIPAARSAGSVPRTSSAPKKPLGSSRAPASKTAAEDKRIAKEHKDDKAETKREKVRAKLAASRSQRKPKPAPAKTLPTQPKPTRVPAKDAPITHPHGGREAGKVAQKQERASELIAAEIKRDLPLGKVTQTKAGFLSTGDLNRYSKAKTTHIKVLDLLEKWGVITRQTGRAAKVSVDYQYTPPAKVPGMVQSGETYQRKATTKA